MKRRRSWSSIEPFPHGRLIRRFRPGEPDEIAIHISGDAVAAALAKAVAADPTSAATRPRTQETSRGACKLLVMPARARRS